LVARGKVHDYLGIQIDFAEDQKVKMTMYDIKETPAELMEGSSVTPAANHLFTVNPECVKLNDDDAAIYHHLTAKLLYLSKRTGTTQPSVDCLILDEASPTLMIGRNWDGVCVISHTRDIFLLYSQQTILGSFDGGLMPRSQSIPICAATWEQPCHLGLVVHMPSHACRN
jgi:hypothetical protein